MNFHVLMMLLKEKVWVKIDIIELAVKRNWKLLILMVCFLTVVIFFSANVPSFVPSAKNRDFRGYDLVEISSEISGVPFGLRNSDGFKTLENLSSEELMLFSETGIVYFRDQRKEFSAFGYFESGRFVEFIDDPSVFDFYMKRKR